MPNVLPIFLLKAIQGICQMIDSVLFMIEIEYKIRLNINTFGNFNDASYAVFSRYCRLSKITMKMGLTGGIGCGKSTVVAAFGEAGFKCCETDAIVKQLLREDPEVIAAVVAHFGRDFISESGGICRKKLAEVVFREKDLLQWLENLLHPRVRLTWQKRVADAPNAHWCIEIPLLFEKNLEKHFDFIVCVSCSNGNQLDRLRQRGLSDGQISARNACQLPLNEKVMRSNVVFSNDGTKSFLNAQINYFIENFVHRKKLPVT